MSVGVQQGEHVKGPLFPLSRGEEEAVVVVVDEFGSSDDDEEEEEEEEEKEVVRGDCFGSLDSLKSSLPIKRGLSNFYNGKSKSFTSISDIAVEQLTVDDLVKPENPFNKRRRLLTTNRSRLSRRGPYTSLSTATSLPPLVNPPCLPSVEEDEEEQCKDGRSTIPSLTHLSSHVKIS